MSNSIWKTPDQKPKGHKTVIEHWLNCYNEHCYDMWKQRPDGGSFDSHTIEWCYVDDLIAQADKAERLQKAVDLAVDVLKRINKTYEEEYHKGDDEHDSCDWLNCADDMDSLATDTIDEIKQLIKGE